MSSSIGQTLTFLLLATCDEILSWMIEIWMKNVLVSGSNCNIVILLSSKNLQGMRNNIGLTYRVGDTYYSLQLVLSKTIRIGDTKYRNKCRKHLM